MNVFESVKENVTARQAAEMYGIRINRNSMACCPFHDDKHPSMKVDKRFHCFGCQEDGEAVAGKLSDTCEAEQKGQKEALERSLAKDEERINILEKMVLRLYEDIAAGRINEQNFNLMLEKTQKEQEELKAKISEEKKKVADEIQLVNSARQWITAIQEYADIAELDAAVLNKLVKEIVVHEEIDSDKTRHISIEIHFNLKPIPEVEQVRK